MKMTMTEAEALGRIKMGVNVDIKRSDGKHFKLANYNHDLISNRFLKNRINLAKNIVKVLEVLELYIYSEAFIVFRPQ